MIRNSCLKCGRCMEVCPALVHDPGFNGPRALAVDRSRRPWGSELDTWSCTSCGACVEACPVCQPLTDAMRLMRQDLQDTGHLRMLSNLEAHGRSVSRGQWSMVNMEGTHLYFPGCMVAERMPETIGGLVTLTSGFGGLRVPDGWVCCGSPPHRIGKVDVADELAQTNRALLQGTVYTSCPGCAERLGEDGVDTRHVLELIYDHIDELDIQDTSIRVALHHPCHMMRGMGREVLDKAYAIINAVPGTEVVHMRDRDRCCGGGGGVMSARPEVALRMARERVDQAVAAGAELLLAPCPFCVMNLRRADRLPTMGLLEWLTSIIA